MSILDKPAMPGLHPSAECRYSEEGITIRQHAALTLRVPMSGDPELDAMIREARRLDMATAAMPMIREGLSAEFRAKCAYDIADALLAASEPKKAEPHQWDSDGERCLKCGDKDWMAGPTCSGSSKTPQPDAEGWIEWHGGECPVRWDTYVEIECRNGEMDKSVASQFYWKDDGDDCDIVAYRVVK